MILSPVSRATITSALKKSNQRLAQLAKSLKQANAVAGKDYDPWKSSSLLKGEIAEVENGVYGKYLTRSEAGKKFYKYENGKKVVKNVTTGGNVKFDIRQIMKDIESGALDYSEANDFLVKAAGLRISENGEVTETETGGISTVSEIKKKAKEIFGENLPTGELLNKYDEMTEFRESFQQDYSDFKAQETLASVETDPMIQKLRNRAPGQDYLDYEELSEIHQYIRDQLGRAKPSALNYERHKNKGKTTYGGNK